VTTHNRKLKVIEFVLLGVNFECQVASWKMNNNTDDGDKLFSFCGPSGGEFRSEATDDYSLDLTFYSDWRSAGISRFLTVHNGEDAAFKLDHHPDIPLEHVYWEGTVKLRAPNVGGDARATEMTETTLVVVGKPTFFQADES
jgi:hypothetical protein